MKPVIVDKRNIKKILLMRSDGIGDFILSLPALNAIRKCYSNAHITLFTGNWQEEIAMASNIFNEIIIWNSSKNCYFIAPEKLKFFTYQMLKYIPGLTSHKFDIAIDFRNDYFINRIIMWLSRARIRLGFNRGGLEFLLTHCLPDREDAHKSLRFLELVSPLIDGEIESSSEINILETSHRRAEDFLDENNISQDDRVVIIHPAARWPAKVWPLMKFAKLGDKILELPKTKVIFIGDKSDLPAIFEIGRLMRKRPYIAAGRLSLMEAAALIKRGKVFIGNDAAPMQLAAALGIFTIGLFGPTEQNIFGPLKANSFSLRKVEDACAGCLKKYCIYPDKFCMGRIPVDEVYSAVKKFLT